jgi:hypothetical protein
MSDTIDFVEDIENEGEEEDYIRQFEEISKQNIDKKPKGTTDTNARQKFDSADYMMKHQKQQENTKQKL